MNQMRLNNTNKWVFAQVELNKKVYLIKSFNTSPQILLRLDTGINYGGAMDLKIGEWKTLLSEFFAA